MDFRISQAIESIHKLEQQNKELEQKNFQLRMMLLDFVSHAECKTYPEEHRIESARKLLQ